MAKARKLLNDLDVKKKPGAELELSIIFVNDQQIRELNRIYRKKDRATDVLAFAQREGKFADPEDPILGDIVISVESAQRQAKERGRSLEQELDLLLIHGILHLLGYEHEFGGRQAQKMRAKEKELWNKIQKLKFK